MSYEKIRLLFFTLSLTIALLLEYKFSYQERKLKRINRWPGNLLMIFSASALVSLFKTLDFFPFTYNGLFQAVNLPYVLELILSIILLDFFIYLQHVMTHKIPFFWRFHVIHHSDIDLDATSALRFHPVEILGSFIYKMLILYILGISIEALIIFEIILSTMSIFNHSNLYITDKVEKFLRIFIVTPQMHLVHHSTKRSESDRNYGFNLSCWDYLFKTYKSEMSESSIIGQDHYRSVSDHKFFNILKRPFLRSERE